MVALVAIAAAACSTTQWDTSSIDHPTPTAPKEYVRDTDGVRQSLIDHLSTVGTNLNEWAPPRDQATCVADRVIQRIGVDRLLELGYDPNDGKLGLPYAPDEQTAMLNIISACIDFKEGLVEMLSAYQKISFKSATCVAEGLDRLGLIRLYAASLLIGQQPDPFDTTNDLSKGTTDVLGQCVPANELTPATPDQLFPQDFDATTTTTAKPKPKATTTTGLGSSDLSGSGGIGVTTTATVDSPSVLATIPPPPFSELSIGPLHVRMYGLLIATRRARRGCGGPDTDWRSGAATRTFITDLALWAVPGGPHRRPDLPPDHRLRPRCTAARRVARSRSGPTASRSGTEGSASPAGSPPGSRSASGTAGTARSTSS